jgi:hypothetical protein
MDEVPLPSLSPSERRTLEYIREGGFLASDLDWVAFQRLKAMGLAEVGGLRPKLTKEGKRVLRRLRSPT